MIPALVALIADADDPEKLRTVERLAAEVGGVPPHRVCLEEQAASREHLPEIPVRELVPQRGRATAVDKLLAGCGPEVLVPELKSPADALSVKAGLYLIHDYLDEAHQLAQEADELGHNRTASYWHGIMHRREPDYDNARYWFRRVGRNPIHPQLGREVASLLEDASFRSRLQFDRVLDRHGHWDAMAFVDLCQECGRRWDARAQAAARLQAVEMRILLEFSCREAKGTPEARD